MGRNVHMPPTADHIAKPVDRLQDIGQFINSQKIK